MTYRRGAYFIAMRVRARSLRGAFELNIIQLTMAMEVATTSEDVPDSPHQPGQVFASPKRSFGKKTVVQRSFQYSWFAKWPFLHYNVATDSFLPYLLAYV